MPQRQLIYLLMIIMVFATACGRNKIVAQKKLPGHIPTLFYDALDARFSKNQDAVLYNQRRFSGYVYGLFNKQDTAFEIGYLNGLQEGFTKRWYPNKQVMEERFYIQGGKEGIHKGWWEDGKPKFIYHFVNDEYEGLATDWFSTGKMYRQFNYKQGHEAGREKMWWEDGTIRANYVIINGEKFGLSGQKLCVNSLTKIKN